MATSVYRSLEELRLRKHPVEMLSGIYFLWYGDTLVYIGQSSNGTSRIMDHKKDKLFDSWYWIPVVEKYLDDVEYFYIEKFKPEYNKVCGSYSLDNLSEFFNIPKSDVRTLLNPAPVKTFNELNINSKKESVNIRVKQQIEKTHKAIKTNYTPKKKWKHIKFQSPKKYDTLTPKQQRDIKLMYHHKKMKYTQIADKLKLPASKIQSFLARSKAW